MITIMVYSAVLAFESSKSSGMLKYEGCTVSVVVLRSI